MLHPARISSRSIMLHILQPYVVLWFCRVCQTQLRLMLPKIQLSALCSRDHVHGAARRSALRRCADMYVCVCGGTFAKKYGWPKCTFEDAAANYRHRHYSAVFVHRSQNQQWVSMSYPTTANGI